MNSECTVVDLRCEHLVNPLGLHALRPRLSWRLHDERMGARQTAWQVQAASTAAGLEKNPDLWDSGRVTGDTCLDVVWAGRKLISRDEVCWRVRVWDLEGVVSAWSQPANFAIGLMHHRNWQAQWIGRPEDNPDESTPSPFLRHHFSLNGAIKQARLYITARGIFEAYINGRRLGDAYFAPGWTDYNKRFQVSVYDVTEHLSEGDNVLGAILGDGWYAGYLGWKDHRARYGAQKALLAQLEITYRDGHTLKVTTNEAWRQTTGPILQGDFYNGESYDARLEMPGWATTTFDDRQWEPVSIFSATQARLTACLTEPVRVQEELKVCQQSEPEPGVHVFDLGQNIVGWARIHVRAPAGTRVTIRYAEMLQDNGSLYTENLRSAKCTDVYVCRGDDEEIWEPRFTFHGFRYVELSGLSQKPKQSDVTGIVLHSDMPSTGTFACSDKLVNQLQSNIVWGQRGNYLEVPTDCPQRDERLGWTGDAQVFIRTGCFNRDVAAFFTKWCQDLEDAQLADGAFPHVAPDVLTLSAADETVGAAAWADAGVICPWTIYLCYGDTRILERHYQSMAAWVKWREATSCDLIHGRACFGDWLALDNKTPRDLIATAYFARTTSLLAEIARLLGNSADAKYYTALARRIRTAFNREFVTPTGRIMGDTQTAYLLALGFDLLPPSKRECALERLVKDIKSRNWTLSTGFVGTPLLAPVLTKHGRTDVAYRLLMQTEYPSWIYSILQGATTMWERWNSYTHQDGFGDAGMNSFNHYAYGAIGEWLYNTVAGIDLDPKRPGYKHILIQPQPGGGLTWARGELMTRYGRIVSHWRIEKRRLNLDVTIPPNTIATVTLPGHDSKVVTAGTFAFNIPWEE